MTCDTWHVSCDSKWMNAEAVSRTVPATPGLSKIIIIIDLSYQLINTLFFIFIQSVEVKTNISPTNMMGLIFFGNLFI